MSNHRSPDILELVAERFRVLGEPTRLLILDELMSGERSVSELVEKTGLNQANVSKHLALLRSSGFVDRRKDGVYAFYTIADPSVSRLCEIMCGRIERLTEERSALLATGT